MSISFMLYNQEGALFRIAPLPNDAELYLSNDNAFDVLDAIGIEACSWPWPIACFRSLLTVARLKRLRLAWPNSVPTAKHRETDHMHMIDYLRAEDNVGRHLKNLSDLVNTGLEAGATHVGWG